MHRVHRVFSSSRYASYVLALLLVSRVATAASISLPTFEPDANELGKPCVGSPLKFENDRVKSDFFSNPGNTALLFSWAKKAYKSRFDKGACTDWDLAVRTWQRAIGTPVSGIIGEVLFTDVRRRAGQDDVAWEKQKSERVPLTIQAADQAWDSGNKSLALRILHRLSETGNTKAQCAYAWRLLDPKDVPLRIEQKTWIEGNRKDAFKWLDSAQSMGDTCAPLKYGLIHYFGIGVPKSHSKAAQWFRQAADNGDPLAQNNLGLLYAEGKGVRENKNEAIRLFRLAANQNLDPKAKSLASHNLSVALGETGRGGQSSSHSPDLQEQHQQMLKDANDANQRMWRKADEDRQQHERERAQMEQFERDNEARRRNFEELQRQERLNQERRLQP